MDYKEFENKMLKKGNHHKAKVNNSWGVYSAYKHIRKNKWYDIGRPLKEGEFYAIIRNVNKYLASEIAKGNTITLPSRMGKLELRKQERGVSIVDGKLRITYPINWHDTLRLWYEDPEEMKKKTLVRRNTSQVYRVKYNKWTANYENQSYYEFTLNRFIKLALKDNINKGLVDTLW